MPTAMSADAPERSRARREVAGARRVVVKVGSSSLTDPGGGLDRARLEALVDALAKRRAGGVDVVLVSSGAVASGLRPLGISRRPRDLASQQAAASVGQLSLVHAYAAAFGARGLTVGQVLLTADDVMRRAHYRNAQRTLARLLALGAVPVVNENDTVVTEEIRFGDNDRLAALVAHLAGADALLLLSDVDGVYDGNPREAASRRIAEVCQASELDPTQVVAAGSPLGTGGMSSKLAAAELAAGAGIPVLIASANHAGAALRAEGGTAFLPRAGRLSARRFWLGYAAGATGALVCDAGAVAAVTERRRSLLAAGVVEVRGEFQAGDVVELRAAAGGVVGRGVVSYDSRELVPMIGRSSHELEPERRRAVVHADDLVPLGVR
jgi:glutamate 5-kinase